jgi:O-antigen/teichoic acid export membrane protein
VSTVDASGMPRIPGDRRSDLSQLARGSTANLAGSVVAACLNLVLPVIITRSLAQADAGLFFQATALFTILLNVGTVGADTGVLRALPRALALDRRGDLYRLLTVAVVPALVFSVALSVGLVALAGPLGGLVAGGTGQAGDFEEVLTALAPWVPVAVVYAITMSASRGLGSVRPLVLVEKIGRNALETGAAGIAASVSTSVALVVTAWVAPYAAMLVVVGIWVGARLRRVVARQGPLGAPSTWRPLATEFWRFSAPRALSRVFTVALQRFDVLVVGALRGPADAAVYAAATRFLVLGLMFVQAIQQVMAPRISEFLATGEEGRAETLYRTTTTWLTLVSWPIYLMVMWFATLMMSIFGTDFERGATAVVILCGAMLVATSCGPVDSVLLMGGRSVLSLINTGLALLVNVGLDLWLVPRYGVTGAAAGWGVAILVNNLLPLWQVNRYHRMHPLGAGTRTAMWLSLATFGALAGGVRLYLGDDLLAFVVAGTLATMTFLVLARHYRAALELDALLDVARRRRRGGQGRQGR